MAVPEDSSSRTSLINASETQPEEEEDTHLDQALHRIETFLRLLGFCQYSPLSFALSWFAFLLIGLLLPLLIIEFSLCSDCQKYQIKSFELEILISEAIVSSIALLSISYSLRKYRIRKFLFVDRCHGHILQFRDQYIQNIDGFFRLLALWVLPCFLLKTVREVFRIIYVHDDWWLSVATLFVLLVSWTYKTIIYLSASALFNLVCNFQVIHFENYGRLLERDLDVLVFIEEHARLKHHLSKISHRFRIYLILEFLVVTASQCVVLLETTGNRGIITFVNGGDFVVCSIVQLVGMILCLHAAAKITHRAQGVASVASRWHALVTCNSGDDSQLATSTNGGNLEAAYLVGSLAINYSESDLESVDYVSEPMNTQMASYVSSYHKRQAFVVYLQSNTRGFTIFGWTIDRTLINTIFFVEMSLALFVLGKTITFTTK